MNIFMMCVFTILAFCNGGRYGESNQSDITRAKGQKPIFRSRGDNFIVPWPDISAISSDHSGSNSNENVSGNKKLEPYKILQRTTKQKKITNTQEVYSRTTVSKSPSEKSAGRFLREGDDDTNPIGAHNLKEYFEKFASELTDYNMNVIVLNRTVEYNDIVLLKLTSKPDVELPEDTKEDKSEEDKNEEDDVKQPDPKPKPPNDKFEDEPPEKKIVFIVHGLNSVGFRSSHALYFPKYFNLLLSIYKKLLRNYDVFLMPMANPDGLSKQTWSTLWAKNNSPQNACNGVALDRNFDISWKESNFSSCNPLYPGTRAFSELESRAIHQVLEQNQVRIHAFFHVHAPTFDSQVTRSEALLYPFGYTDVQGESEDKFLELKSEIEEAMAERFTHFRFLCESMYNYYHEPIYGSSVDFAYKVFGIPYAFEVLMQTYDDPELTETALNTVWKKVFKIIFKSLSKSNANDD